MRTNKMRGVVVLLAAAAAVATVAACGSGGGGGGASSSGTGSTPQAVTTRSALTGGGLTTRSTSIGTVLADTRGHTVYELQDNPAGNPKCTASCQAYWSPVMVGGTQAVMQGHPLFTFVGDAAGGQTKGQDVSDTWGTWYAVDPHGTPIEESGGDGGPVPASSSSSSGGYGY